MEAAAGKLRAALLSQEDGASRLASRMDEAVTYMDWAYKTTGVDVSVFWDPELWIRFREAVAANDPVIFWNRLMEKVMYRKSASGLASASIHSHDGMLAEQATARQCELGRPLRLHSRGSQRAGPCHGTNGSACPADSSGVVCVPPRARRPVPPAGGAGWRYAHLLCQVPRAA